MEPRFKRPNTTFAPRPRNNISGRAYPAKAHAKNSKQRNNDPSINHPPPLITRPTTPKTSPPPPQYHGRPGLLHPSRPPAARGECPACACHDRPAERPYPRASQCPCCFSPQIRQFANLDHLQALFSILDHSLRRNADQDRVIGTLLGVRSEDGSEVEIRNCFAVGHNESQEQVCSPHSPHSNTH